MGVNHRVSRAFGLNRRHVAGDTLASCASVLMVRVFLNCRCAWPVWRRRAVTIKTELIGGLAQLRIVRGAVNVVTIETRYASTIHHALNKIVPLHAILVCSPVGEIEKILRLS